MSMWAYVFISLILVGPSDEAREKLERADRLRVEAENLLVTAEHELQRAMAAAETELQNAEAEIRSVELRRKALGQEGPETELARRRLELEAKEIRARAEAEAARHRAIGERARADALARVAELKAESYRLVLEAESELRTENEERDHEIDIEGWTAFERVEREANQQIEALFQHQSSLAAEYEEGFLQIDGEFQALVEQLEENPEDEELAEGLASLTVRRYALDADYQRQVAELDLQIAQIEAEVSHRLAELRIETADELEADAEQLRAQADMLRAESGMQSAQMSHQAHIDLAESLR